MILQSVLMLIQEQIQADLSSGCVLSEGGGCKVFVYVGDSCHAET